MPSRCFVAKYAEHIGLLEQNTNLVTRVSLSPPPTNEELGNEVDETQELRNALPDVTSLDTNLQALGQLGWAWLKRELSGKKRRSVNVLFGYLSRRLIIPCHIDYKQRVYLNRSLSSFRASRKHTEKEKLEILY